MQKFIRNRRFRDEQRIAITVRAMNADRVVYHYPSPEGRTAIGCVSRAFFDANYRRLGQAKPRFNNRTDHKTAA